MKHPILKSVVAAAGAIAVVAGGIGWLALADRHPDFDPDRPSAFHATHADLVDPAAQIARGAYLAKVGNCMACHTARSGMPYAGGRAVPTPFGNVYAPNLTADRETGIGNWSSSDFWRAMHDGKSRDGSLLYPAFPFTNYTKITRTDVDAMFAFFKTIPAAHRENNAPELRFPYNQRWLLYGWRALYFTPGSYVEDKKQSVAWNRGAYLTQGLGHCSACHSVRDRFGGTSLKTELGGGTIPVLNWYASPLNGDPKTGLGGWEMVHLTALLATGVAPERSVSGPMAEVVGRSLQHWSEQDIGAMALYLKSLPRQMPPAEEETESVEPEQRKEILAAGAKLYEKHCVACHQADGKGAAGIYPSLAGSAAVVMGGASNAIHIVLEGGFAPSTAGNPRPYGMPPFAQALNDAEIAAVVSYLRHSWGNTGNLVSQVEVNRYRSKLTD